MKKVKCGTVKSWRSWLSKNHLKENKVNLIIHKKHTGEKFMSHNEQIREAICFGWIDTTVKRIDEDTFQRSFVKRTEKSRWSENTLRYGREEIEKGRMSDFGVKMYKLGLKKKPHDYDIPKNPKTPEELKEALVKKKLDEKWEKLAPSKKKMFLLWLWRGKREETREKRIKEIVKMTESGGTLGVVGKDV